MTKLGRVVGGLQIVKHFSTIQNQVLKKETKDVGVITLNKPDTLNTLTWSMSAEIYQTLKEWESEKKLVIMKGAGQKAFSAGADLKSVFQYLEKNSGPAQDLSMYMNANVYLLSRYKIPYVALINGITMGGGVGLSINGKYQVASEKTVWAMPETKIGFYPNVGASYFLSRLPKRLGRYLGLTGKSLMGSDVVRAGLASHFADSRHFEDLEQKLMYCSLPREVVDILNEFNKSDLPEFSLAPVLDKIDYCFSGESMEEIMKRLEKDGSTWAEDTIKALAALSPTSLKVSLRELQQGEHITLRDALIMEYRMNNNILKKQDFHEGIRALLIDKDKNPKWTPSSFSEVSEDLVRSHFLKVPEEENQMKLLQ
ncbi:3-hydroxyisobutyryl-CoA hydrolase, mitochondrial [Leptinotarsa decemlineata]|uniref:3-hydroxyisobutyryl-CoA hydrolase, mitochondrial n=1 Tax=Leptinotarsa decemlineata TaxID=7539 RepID=UPI000C252A89|nr:3-hydroxyisobutyryl-CoA hydrolase, mitochondrial-like [Leptinotarsa decemlineata]